jgi:hypothetical protein
MQVKAVLAGRQARERRRDLQPTVGVTKRKRADWSTDAAIADLVHRHRRAPCLCRSGYQKHSTKHRYDHPHLAPPQLRHPATLLPSGDWVLDGPTAWLKIGRGSVAAVHQSAEVYPK